MKTNDAHWLAVATCAEKIGGALRALAVELRSATAGVEAPPQEPPGARQQQILEVHGLAKQEGMRVAEVSRAIGGYDVANTHLALRSLEKKGAVELVPGVAPQRWRLTQAYRKGRRVWDREELILALQCYVAADGQPTPSNIEDLKSDLVLWALARGLRGRSIGSVSYKLGNFRAIATNGREGFPHWGSQDKEVFDEFSGDPHRLSAEADRILRDLEDGHRGDESAA